MTQITFRRVIKKILPMKKIITNKEQCSSMNGIEEIVLSLNLTIKASDSNKKFLFVYFNCSLFLNVYKLISIFYSLNSSYKERLFI